MKTKLIPILMLILMGASFINLSCRSSKEPKQITEEQRIRQDRDKMQFERRLDRETERERE